MNTCPDNISNVIANKPEDKTSKVAKAVSKPDEKTVKRVAEVTEKIENKKSEKLEKETKSKVQEKQEKTKEDLDKEFLKFQKDQEKEIQDERKELEEKEKYEKRQQLLKKLKFDGVNKDDIKKGVGDRISEPTYKTPIISIKKARTNLLKINNKLKKIIKWNPKEVKNARPLYNKKRAKEREVFQDKLIDLKSNVELRLKKTAYSVFTFSKEKKIHEIGEILTQIDNTLTELQMRIEEDEALLQNAKNKGRGGLLSFFFDKKYHGMDTEQILKKSGFKEKQEKTELIKINKDTISEIVGDDTKIEKSGLLGLLKIPKKEGIETIDPNSIKNVTESDSDDKQISEILSVNKRIAENIADIREYLRPKQDTSIADDEKTESIEKLETTKTETKPEKEDDKTSWFANLFSKLFGSNIFKLLRLGSLTSIATKLLKSGMGFLQSTISAGINLAKNALDAGVKIAKNVFTTGKNLVKKSVSTVSNSVKKGASKVSNIGKGVAKKGVAKASSVGKQMLKFVKFAKVIPGLGWALTAGLAAKSAYDGYTKPEETFNEPPENITAAGKVMSAIGAVAEDITFGMWSKQKAASSVAKLAGVEVIKNGLTSEIENTTTIESAKDISTEGVQSTIQQTQKIEAVESKLAIKNATEISEIKNNLSQNIVVSNNQHTKVNTPMDLFTLENAEYFPI